MVTIKQPLTVENPTCCSLWYGRPGVTCCYCQREACGVGPVEDTTLYSYFNEGLLDVHDVEEMLGLVQLRSESKDDNDGDGGLPDCYCFPLCFCFFVSSLIFLYCSVALCYYWEMKAKTMVMVGDVCSAERGGQGWYGGSFGLKPKRKRKAMKGLFWLFLVTGKKRRKEAGGMGQLWLV
uniref:Uncharacterized protein n=1 Tax=Populus alba TaxID=43335 RepID=A0A4U5Q9K0_POPAL|nr:hypothetical protein D5086_0000137640 [Populus alba]